MCLVVITHADQAGQQIFLRTIGPIVHVVARAISGNPASPPVITPPIIYEYVVTLNRLTGIIRFQGSHSQYPWHEALIQLGHDVIYGYRYSPNAHLVNNPTRLFAGNTFTFVEEIYTPQIKSHCW